MAVIQANFCVLFYMIDIPIFNNNILVGYATMFTILPCLQLMLDVEIDTDTVCQNAQIYRILNRGR